MFGEIVKFTLPALITFLTAFFMIRLMLKREEENRKIDAILKNQKMITPIRLQAYERLVLFLERISPNHLIMRVQQPGMKVQELQRQLLANIRTEFEHNLSQQVYISHSTWEIIRNAKEQTIKLINSCADSISPDANCMLLTKEIFDKLIELEKAPNQVAIDKLKDEISNLF
ncbi:MAG: hypothetical protein PHF99_12215 [Bacteroidales bacterium]|nr:hypothetical protein [Bacteroidales bacterium]MDD4236770.1 hypothetical protein [Bacteroidales bacterium]